jgi:hypothetical protein
MWHDHSIVMRNLQVWLKQAVIGLNLCPFAKAVFVRGQIHYAVTDSTRGAALLAELEQELLDLRDADPQVRETTLMVAPQAFAQFEDMLEFLGEADRLLERMGLEGEIQIASFHPRYQFAGTGPDDIENFTNRSPYPVMHLLREQSVDRAVAAYPDAAAIYNANIITMRALGHDGWRQLMRGLRHGS